MPLSILFGTRTPQKAIGGIQIDAFTSETMDWQSDVTSHAVEQGGEVSDHVSNRPMELAVTGVIPSNVGISPLGQSRRNEVYEKLKELHEAREPVDVVAGLEVYSDMIMVMLTIDRNVRNSSGLSFNARFRHVRIASSERVDLGRLASPDVSLAASAAKNIGRQTTEVASESDSASSSILFSVFGR